ncbi:Ig-like domain-containing protein [Sulfurovum sp.]|uniref:Ig-like domain-containing protein n=1 Tax=Sulfurovum sp. TaxID=1969726 RepID=UPI0025E0D0BF|nr:Ig-like domain-containing protein [Sulfurovum sp.]
MKILHYYFFILFLSISLTHANTSQLHLVDIKPKPSSTDVSPTTTLSLTFDKYIIQSSVKDKTIQLKRITPEKNQIKGTVSIKDKNILTFMPSQPLEKGVYKVKVKPIKLQKEESNEIKPHTTWQKFVAKLCALIYDDISDCPLCQYFCNAQNNITTKPIKFTFEVKDNAPKVISLDTNTTLIELSEHNATQIKLTATYEDNSSEDVTQKATYISNDSAVDVENGNVTTHQEGSATVTATYADKSVEIQVKVYEKIEGHLLPHAPDNPDATLLGVDTNHNGVRDEVERWIYKEMPTYHHPEIERVIAMTKAKALQMTLVDPANKDNKVYNEIKRAHDCWYHYSYSRDIPFDGAVQKFGNRLRDQQFNTKERLKVYLDYDYTLKGRITTSTPTYLLNTNLCDKNIDILP